MPPRALLDRRRRLAPLASPLAATRHVAIVLLALCLDGGGTLAQTTLETARVHKQCAFDQQEDVCANEPVSQFAYTSFIQGSHHKAKVHGVASEHLEAHAAKVKTHRRADGDPGPVGEVLGKGPTLPAVVSLPEAPAGPLARSEASSGQEPQLHGPQAARANSSGRATSGPAASAVHASLANASWFPDSLWDGVRVLEKHLALSQRASQVLKHVSTANTGNFSSTVFAVCLVCFGLLVCAFLALALAADQIFAAVDAKPSDPNHDETLSQESLLKIAQGGGARNLPSRSPWAEAQRVHGTGRSPDSVGRVPAMLNPRSYAEVQTPRSHEGSVAESVTKPPFRPTRSNAKRDTLMATPFCEISTGTEVPEGLEADLVVPFLPLHDGTCSTYERVLVKTHADDEARFEARFMSEDAQGDSASARRLKGAFRLCLREPTKGLVYAYCRLERHYRGGRSEAALIYHYTDRFIGRLVRERGNATAFTLILANEWKIIFTKHRDGTMRVAGETSDWMEVIPMPEDGICSKRRVHIGQLVDVGLMLTTLLATDWLESEYELAQKEH